MFWHLIDSFLGLVHVVSKNEENNKRALDYSERPCFINCYLEHSLLIGILYSGVIVNRKPLCMKNCLFTRNTMLIIWLT